MAPDSKKRTERLQVLLDDAELRALDEWRFRNRMPSRAAAIRELLRRGLRADTTPRPNAQRSEDYSVVDEEVVQNLLNNDDKA